MTRIDVLKKIIEKKGVKNYLEIGVFTGVCFKQISAKRKIAVDPSFRIPWEERADTLMKKISRRFFNAFELYIQKTSDDFFSEESTLLKRFPLDLLFIDGLHTYEQTMKDVTNALKYIKDDGVIVLHDCNPESETIGYPAESLEAADKLNLPDWQGIWSGDVWKTIVHLKSTRDDISIFVLDTDCGLGIVTKRKSSKLTTFPERDLPSLSYKDLDLNRQVILDLKPISYFPTFIESLV